MVGVGVLSGGVLEDDVDVTGPGVFLDVVEVSSAGGVFGGELEDEEGGVGVVAGGWVPVAAESEPPSSVSCLR